MLEFGFSETVSISIWPRTTYIGKENANYNNDMGSLTREIATLKRAMVDNQLIMRSQVTLQ